jgi:hypothetical protein
MMTERLAINNDEGVDTSGEDVDGVEDDAEDDEDGTEYPQTRS